MSRIDPIRSMSSIYGKFHRKQLDAVYFLLWAYSSFQRMELTQRRKKEKGPREVKCFSGDGMALFVSPFGTEVRTHPYYGFQ